MKKIFLLLILNWVRLVSFAQPLKVGEFFPLERVNNVFNSSSDVLDFKSIKRKLIILDFWATNCYGCIASFPDVDSVQKLFHDKVQFIMVNQDTKDSTERFFTLRKKIKVPQVPFVTSDKKLNALFPHDGVPCHVWIDSNWIVRYITTSTYANPVTIANYLSGRDTRIVAFHTGRTKINSVLNSEYDEKVEYLSLITHCIEGNQQDYSDSLLKRSARLTTKCVSVLELYKMAFNERDKFDFGRPGRIDLEVNDSFKYVKPRDKSIIPDWYSMYAYNYELIIPKRMEARKFSIMREDLQRYFGLNAKIEKRKRNCLVLLRTTQENKIKSKGGEAINSFFQSDEHRTVNDSLRILQNQPYENFSRLIRIWIEKEKNLPFVDATGLNGNIDLQFKGETIDNIEIDNLNEELQKFGLRIEEQQYEIDVLVISEK